MIKGNFLYSRQIGTVKKTHRLPAKSKFYKSNKDLSFQTVLEEKLKFSKHASRRLNSRNMELSTEEVKRLENAIGRARSKGARESLVLMDQKAFVVSVKNNTVITAVGKEQLKENVFTNIDSTVIG